VIAVMQMLASPPDSLVGLGIVIAGLPVYGVWSRPRSANE
jgi:hypothetical protein